MSNALKREQDSARSEPAISFSKKYAASQNFLSLFREGMELIEETSEYLECDGRSDSRALEDNIALTYTTESMRLTTRLMQLASWLVIYRGIAQGKLTPADIEEKRKKIRFDTVARPEHIDHFDELPAKLRSLIEQSMRLYDQIESLDRHLLSSGFDVDAPRQNPLSTQMAELEEAFCTPE